MTLGYPIRPDYPTIESEIEWRKDVFTYITKTYEDGSIPPLEIKALGAYGGAAGFWGDKQRTKTITSPDGPIPDGLCVSIMHTGKTYADSLTNNHIFYHYPKTGRPGSTDNNEIAAARNAMKYRVPIFVILQGNSNYRMIRLGWIVADIPDERVFVVEFAKNDPGRLGNREVRK